MNKDISKTLLSTIGNYRIYTIKAMDFRKQSIDCQEFGDYGIHSWYPKIIPANEIWVSDTLSGNELSYNIDAALYQSKEIARGISEHKAYLGAERKEKIERQKNTSFSIDGKKPKTPPSDLYIKLYTTLSEDNTKIYLIDEELVQDIYKEDFVEGGNHSAYPWVPEGEVWLDSHLHPEEIPYIIIHEYVEMILMREKKLKYPKAHKIASKVEFKYRTSHTYLAHILSSVISKLSEDWVLNEAKNLL